MEKRILKAGRVYFMAPCLAEEFDTDPCDALNKFFTEHDGAVLLFVRNLITPITRLYGLAAVVCEGEDRELD